MTLAELTGNSPLFKIAEFLIENKEKDFTKKEIAEGAGISRASLFNHWEDIEKYGIVKVTRKFGKTKLYTLEETPIVRNIIQLNKSLVTGGEQKLNKEIIIKKLEENKEEIKNLGVKSIALFGSYATNEQREDSDIDILVEFKKGRGLSDDFFNLLHLCENLFHKKVDIGERNLIRKELKESILGGKKIEAKI